MVLNGKPSAEVLFEGLQPQMVSTFKTGGDGRRRKWLEEANERLLGHDSTTGESTGLHKYGANHLQEDRDFLAYAIEELLDAVNQAGPICQQRIQRGLEKWGPVKQRLVGRAIEHIFSALDLFAEARMVKE